MADKDDLIESIIDDLSLDQGASYEELAARYAVSVRTVQRYFTAIREDFGFKIEPIEPKGRTPRWRLEGNPKLDLRRVRSKILDKGLSDEEISLVILALNNDGLKLGAEDSRTLEQLKERFIALSNNDNEFARPVRDFIVSMPQISKVKAIESKLLVQLIRCLKSHAWCYITYKSPRSDQARTRKIFPYCIFEHHYGIYVLSYLADKKIVSPLALERIESLNETRQKESKPEIGDYRTYLLQSFDLFMSDELCRVKVWFDKDQAPYVKERLWGEAQRVYDNEDGSIIIEFNTRGLEGVKRWVLSKGSQAQVLEPQLLADQVRAEVEAMVKKT